MLHLADSLGVQIECDTEVTAIDRRADGFTIQSADGSEYDADIVVSDADYAYTEQELLPESDRQYDESYWNERMLASSAFLLNLGVEGDVDPMAHYTLVLPTDWEPHLKHIYDDPTWPQDPAYYVCIPSKSDDEMARPGDSCLFVFVPIASGLEDGEQIRAEYRDLVLADMAEHTGVDVRDRIAFEEWFTVSEFADQYNSLGRSAFGLAHTLFQSAMFRPSHRSSTVENLYFTGSYTNPGIGVPLCLISGEHTATAITNDHT